MFERIFDDLNVTKHQNIFIMSDILSLFSNKSFAEIPVFFSMLKSSVEKLSKSGKTIILPCFTYQFCQTGLFDLSLTKAQTGALPNSLLTSFHFRRSLAPITSHLFSVKNTPQSLFECPLTTFGQDSVYNWLIKNNGLILNLGMPVSQENGWVLSHYVEEMLEVPYRHFKKFNGHMLDNNELIGKCSQHHFVRTDPEKENDFSELNRYLFAGGAISETTYEDVYANAVKASDVEIAAKLLLEKNPHALLKSN